MLLATYTVTSNSLISSETQVLYFLENVPPTLRLPLTWRLLRQIIPCRQAAQEVHAPGPETRLLCCADESSEASAG